MTVTTVRSCMVGATLVMLERFDAAQVLAEIQRHRATVFVYPAEIERIVAAHPAVAMVAVGSVPDETHGELARAYVVLRPGASATEAEVIEHCRGHLAAYKLPRSVRFVPDLPKTSTGKVMRRELRTLDG
jgi:long-chain acyl-CoA synthetase